MFDRADYAGSCRRLICNLQAFRETVVFDIWIRNSDRHRNNILLDEQEPSRRYEIVLIDHSHTFMHTDGSRSGEFMDLGSNDLRFLRPEEKQLVQLLVSHRCQFEDVLCRIEGLPEAEIQGLTQIATMKYEDPPGDFTRKLSEGLLERRKHLRGAISDLCNSLGIA